MFNHKDNIIFVGKREYNKKGSLLRTFLLFLLDLNQGPSD